MPIYHDRAELLRAIELMPDKNFADGVLTDIPKLRRRRQATGQIKYIRVQLPKDLQARACKQINRFTELLGKDLGWTVIVLLLEYPSNRRLLALAESEGREPQPR